MSTRFATATRAARRPAAAAWPADDVHGVAEDQPQQAGPEPGAEQRRPAPTATTVDDEQAADQGPERGVLARQAALGDAQRSAGAPTRARPCTAPGTAPAQRTSRSPRAATPPSSASSTGPPVRTAWLISWADGGAGEERERAAARPALPPPPRSAAPTATARRPADRRPGRARSATGLVHAGERAAPRRARSAGRSRRPGSTPTASNRPRPPSPPRTTPISGGADA